jgi:hypothetical protein
LNALKGRKIIAGAALKLAPGYHLSPLQGFSNNFQRVVINIEK